MSNNIIQRKQKNSNEDDIEFKKTLSLVRGILKYSEIRCICGNRLTVDMLKTRKYWIYAHCSDCRYDYNYEKIIRQHKLNLSKKLNE